MMFYSIAIDGPAGSGKSSIAKKIAEDLNFDYVSSGYFYRACAYYCLSNHIDYHNEQLFTKTFLEKNIDIKWDGKDIILNNENITNYLNNKDIDQIASIIALYSPVRDFVNNNIRQLANLRSIVVDGRDIGTVVLPDATVKIFLDADPKTRAIRRAKQLKAKGINSSINDALNEIIQRDDRDYNREIAPLKKADDAFLVDNSLLTFEETLDKIKRLYMQKVIGVEWKYGSD